MTTGFQFTASCPRCAGGLTADPSTIGEDRRYGPTVVASCASCRAVWILRATILPASLCGTCGKAYDSPEGLAVHVGRNHPDRYQEPTVNEHARTDSQAWRSDAGCLGMEPDLFAPPPVDLRKPPGQETIDQIERAKAVCAVCPVVAECLADADRLTLDLVIRGGMTVEERSNARRRARSAASTLSTTGAENG